jgi:sirohydrochlorin ferrochelatase
MSARAPKKAVAPRTAILLIGHGSRATEAVKVLADVAASLRRKFRGFVVEPCFFELNQPDIQTAIDRAVGQGAGRVLFVPFATYLDGHVGRDLPEHIVMARERHHGLDIRVAPHLGPDPRLVAICSDRIRRGLRAGRWV